MKSTKEIFSNRVSLNSYSPTVNSIDKDNLFTVNSNITTKEKIENLINEEKIKPDGIATLLSEILSDNESLRYYQLMVKEINTAILLDFAHQTQDAFKSGRIKVNKAVYFQGILRKKGYPTKFRK